MRQAFAASRKQGNQFSTELVQSSPNFIYQDGELYCTGDGDDCQYTWISDSTMGLCAWVKAVVERHASDFFRAYQQQSNGNYTLLFERTAEQTSVLFRSSSTPDTINATGIAYGTEIYIQARWLWFILRLITVAASIIVLVLDILDSSKKVSG
jgi:hypothetical protein